MSRIGKLPVTVPAGVQVKVNEDNVVTVKGPLGELSQKVDPNISVTVQNGTVEFNRAGDEKSQKAMHGLYRSLVNNMVVGVSDGYTKALEIIGVGYKFDVKGPRKIELALGFSHKVHVDAPEGITIEADKEEKNRIHIKSHDKQLLGYFAAYIRSLKKPEPYKGKGIRYVGEHVRRKAGKTAGK